MIKKVISIILACVTAAGLSFGAFAENAATQETPKLNYIHTDIEENYISAYRLYEQVMYDQIVFYTNISNGNITSNPVVIELPSELETIFERDGKEIKFTNNAEISAIGSYSLTVIAKGEDILGGEKNDRYYGLFRFRIMESTAIVPPDAGIDVNDWEEEEPVYTSPTLPTEESEPESIESIDTPEAVVSDEQPTVPPDETEAPAGSQGNTSTPATTPSSPDTDQGAADTTEVPLGDTTLIKQTPADNSIQLTTKAGTIIHSNIPANMITTNKVSFSFATNVQYKLYKDGAVIKGYDASKKITDAGKYQLFIYDGSGTLPAEFDFEIMPQFVSALESYKLPPGCQTQKALYEGNMIRANPTSVDLGGDGTYTIDVSYGSYVFTETFVLDNTPPEFGFDRVVDGIAEGGTVTILFKSDDISRYEIYKDGKKAEKQKQTISEPGNYIVRVYDRAGNMTQHNFELEYRMDAMAIVVIIILIAIVIAGVVFFFISKRKFIVR